MIYTRAKFSHWASSFFVAPEFTDVQEFLRFRKDDLREKFLFLVAEADHNGASEPFRLAGVLSRLAEKNDLKYMVITKPEQVCEAIKQASKKVGKIAHVLIQGHGDAKRTHIAGRDNFDQNTIKNIPDCFDGIKPNGRILLISCSTGAPQNGNAFKNIAHTIANLAKRSVIAPTISVAPSITDLLPSDQSPMLYHPQGSRPIYQYVPFYNRNVFQLFSPDFTHCSTRPASHEREQKAVKTIVKELTDNSILPFSKTFNATHSYLGLCADDPKDKALYFSAKDDYNGALDPSYELPMLGPLADQYDLQYQVTDSLETLCKALNNAAKIGSVKMLVIHAHGTPTAGLLFSKTAEGQEKRLTVDDDLACLTKVAYDGTIVVLGGSIGQDASNPRNLAQKIADVSRRIVLAPTCPIYGTSIVAKSLDPVFVQHPGHSYLRNFVSFQCPENNDDLFKTFVPKRDFL